MKTINDIESNKKNLAEYCRTIRINNNYSVEDFATYCGVTRQTVSNFESGRHLSLDLFLKYYALSLGIKEVE